MALHDCTPASEQDDVHACTIVTHLNLGPKATPQAYPRNSSKCPGKCEAAKSSRNIMAQTRILALERSSQAVERTWGTNISEGVPVLQAVSEIFVPGGTNISGVQILRDIHNLHVAQYGVAYT